MKKDNSTISKKINLRLEYLQMLDAPVIMETHGGRGKLYERCYSGFYGVVFEKDPAKTDLLCSQRPDWSVYEGDCIAAISAGAGAHLPINFLDVDPYGQPWPVFEAFFSSDRPHPETMIVVCNDGLRQKLKLNGGWQTKAMQPIIAKYGNDRLFSCYLDVCSDLLGQIAGTAGYRITDWRGYYCGHAQQMTHYAAKLNRS